MNTMTLGAATILVVATVSAGASASDEARVRPNPLWVRSIESPGTPATSATPAGTETWISTPSGVLRVLANAPDSADIARSSEPAATTVRGPNGQAMRVLTGATAAAVAAALPANVVVVEAHGAKMLMIPGVADGQQALAAAATPAPGMRIVDLPPGAVAPVGLPAPMTLYRVTPGPAAPTVAPATPE